MEKIKKEKIVVTVIAVVLVLGLIGISYAFFTANLGGSETTETITLAGGTMDITYSGGSAIEVVNVIPDDNPAAIKLFTVVGNNTTEGLTLAYTITLVVEHNTFSDNAITYTLSSENTGDSGNIVPSITSQIKIASGAADYYLGRGEFTGGTGITHSYTLNIFFPETGENQNEDQGKTFRGYVTIGENTPTSYCATANMDLLKDKILCENDGPEAIEAKGIPNPFVRELGVDTDGLYALADEYGMSYYYRGLKTSLKNDLIFAGMQWKIVRINGDGSIRIIYNGICANNECELTDEGGEIQTVAYLSWNESAANDNKYMGYMYGGASGEASLCRDGAGCATDQQTNSEIKTAVDAWYENNIISQGEQVTSQIVDNLFCNDRQLESEVGGSMEGLAYGGDETYYGASYRFGYNPMPTYKCPRKADRFTVTDEVGNGALTYPVGLISADEVGMAGMLHMVGNTPNYLFSNQSYWTLSPERFLSGYGACMYYAHSGGTLNAYRVDDYQGLRPVINLSPDTIVSGTGAMSDPYKVLLS